MIICVCKNISDLRIKEEVLNGCQSLEQLKEKTGVCSQCKSCERIVQNLIDEVKCDHTYCCNWIE